jgi:hypothetical protein
MGDDLRLVFRPDPKDVPEVMRRTKLILGQPFLTIPSETRPEEHKVLAEIEGHKVRRDDVEMVFNDTVLMNFNYAHTGHRCEDEDPPGSPMAQVRALARKLYGSYGEWVEKHFGVVCMECNRELPEHLENCTAGQKNRNSASPEGEARQQPKKGQN